MVRFQSDYFKPWAYIGKLYLVNTSSGVSHHDEKIELNIGGRKLYIGWDVAKLYWKVILVAQSHDGWSVADLLYSPL